MANELAAVAVLGVVLAATVCTRRPPTLQVGSDAPSDIRAGCEVADHRCSRCHSADRAVDVRATDPKQLGILVRRMRSKPESDISSIDQLLITRCLVFRTFGQPGLDRLDSPAEGGAR